MKKIAYINPVLSIVIGLFISGCLYIPPMGEQTSKEDLEKDLTNFQIGTTTKAEVTEQFGKPDLLDEERFSLYRFSKDYGALFLVGNAPGAVGLVTLGGDYHIVLLEFDENEILKQYEVETIKESAEGPLHTVPRDKTQPEIEIAKIFKEKAFWSETLFNTVAFSPNGKMVAYGNNDGKVWLQNLVTEEETTLNTERSWLCPNLGTSLAFFPDSTLLAILSESAVNIFNTETKQTIVSYKGHGKCGFNELHMPTAMAIAPDGKTIATGDIEGNIKIWNPVTGDEIKNIKAHEEQIVSMAFLPDSHLLATVGLTNVGTVNRWTASLNRSLKIFDLSHQDKLIGQKQGAGVVKFSPDGKILAIERETHVELWEVASNILKRSPDNKLLSNLLDVFIVPIWTKHDTRLRHNIAFSPGGNRLAASGGGIVIYNLDTLEYEWRYITDPVNDLAFSPDSKSLLIANGKGVYLWSIPNKE